MEYRLHSTAGPDSTSYKLHDGGSPRSSRTLEMLPRTQAVVMSGSHTGGSKPELSFSIERILRGNFKTEEEREDSMGRSNVVHTLEPVRTKEKRYDWLDYTRYNPPKLPKSSKRRIKKKRKPGRNPRVPFTSKQLTSLEGKFQEKKYLSNEDVTLLCETLSLPEHRIKIWFQNRRAREKKRSQDDYVDVVGLGNS